MVLKRRLLAAAWIAGATVPLLLVTVYVFGCCVLPFHGVMHKVMPVCHMAMGMIAGTDDGENPAAPAKEKQEPVKRIATEVPRVFRLAADSSAPRAAAPDAVAGYRSFISLGAVRCDQDVGLHVFVETFRI
jgi:hypothetical protein